MNGTFPGRGGKGVEGGAGQKYLEKGQGSHSPLVQTSPVHLISSSELPKADCHTEIKESNPPRGIRPKEVISGQVCEDEEVAVQKAEGFV